MPRSTAYEKTKEVMENYNGLRTSVEWAGNETSNMVARIDKCLSRLHEEQVNKRAPEKYEAFRLYYLDYATQEQIAEKLYTTDRTVRRWITELNKDLSVYLFGVDAIVLQ